MSDIQFEPIKQQLELIQKYLDGTIAQINAMSQNIDTMGKSFSESMQSLSENMRLIIEVIKKGRSNLNDTIGDMSKKIDGSLNELWEEKTLENITKEEMDAVNKLKEINAIVSDNLYMSQLVSIIQNIREMIGKALAIKMKKTPEEQ